MRVERHVPKGALQRTGVLAKEWSPRDERSRREPRSSDDDPGEPCRDTFRVLVTTLRPGSACRAARAAVRDALRMVGVTADGISDSEIIVAELAANAEKHAYGPYELRIHFLSGVPMWCEMVDCDDELGKISAILADLHSAAGDGVPLAESGRGLLLAHALSEGHCYAYPTTMSSGDGTGKAIAFALPCPGAAERGHPSSGPHHDQS